MPTPPASPTSGPSQTFSALSHNLTLPAAPTQAPDQGLQITVGNGRDAQSLHQGVLETREDIDETAHPRQAPPPRHMPPVLAPLVLDQAGDFEEIHAYEIPFPDIEKPVIEEHFIEMRALNKLFLAANDGSEKISPTEATALNELENKMRQSIDWKSAFSIFDQASRRHAIQAAKFEATAGKIDARFAIDSELLPPAQGFIFSIPEQIALNGYQQTFMASFSRDFDDHVHLDVSGEPISWKPEEINAEEGAFALEEESLSIIFSPQEPATGLTGSAIQFWGELWLQPAQPAQPFNVEIVFKDVTRPLDRISIAVAEVLKP
ncbi:hypothetical protein [Ottowia thiooxydans]|uniref:hypothetical protein n=1 Tax=Ottowia thiooxydans TaxID=219182 RepID=UPI0003FF7747|nr:hypothetical protein [Ottowia thiooxydans]